jgi:predicted nucleic acid-binding protein
MYLLDTNAVSEMRKAAKAHPCVRDWAGSVPAASLFISVATILELQKGVLLVERRDARQGAMLRIWLHDHVVPAFGNRVLPFDASIAMRCAELHVPDPRPERDAMIAATALEHGLTVVTRNVRDFQGTGVRLINPWEPQP